MSPSTRTRSWKSESLKWMSSGSEGGAQIPESPRRTGHSPRRQAKTLMFAESGAGMEQEGTRTGEWRRPQPPEGGREGGDGSAYRGALDLGGAGRSWTLCQEQERLPRRQQGRGGRGGGWPEAEA